MVIRNVIGGKYRLRHKIGEGAMGVVWAALNQQTSREVAVKLISSADDQLRQRLIREACTCGQLSHRNIIEVLDAGVTEDRDPYLVMPLLVGETLADLLNRKRRLDAPVVARIARDIAKALTAAHAANVVHRDLKPANIFLHKEAGSDGTVVKVMDFGICKRLESRDEKLTATGKVIGSPSYMSPEQFVPEKGIDHRTDIWSLGVIMFEMLTGERPFQGDRMKVIMSILDFDFEIPRVSRLVRFVPQALVDIVAGCLVREREQRIGSAAELVERLQAITSPGDAGGIYNEASWRALKPPLSEPPSRDTSRLSVPEHEEEEEGAAAVPSFPRSLDDSSIITIPRQPGPRRAAARRRLAGPEVAAPIEVMPLEVEENQSAADESARADVQSAYQAEQVADDDVDDSAATTPLSVRKFAPAAQAAEAPAPRSAPPAIPLQSAHPTTTTPAQEVARHDAPPADSAPPVCVAAGPSATPFWSQTAPLNAREFSNGSAPSGVGALTDPIGTLSQWAPRRNRAVTLRILVIGAMASIASLLFLASFVAAAVNAPAPPLPPEPATPAITELASKVTLAHTVSKPAAQPGVNADRPASSPTETKKPSDKAKVGRAMAGGALAPPARTSKTTAKAPCQKRLLKKC